MPAIRLPQWLSGFPGSSTSVLAKAFGVRLPSIALATEGPPTVALAEVGHSRRARLGKLTKPPPIGRDGG
ncbi:exported hypothetical protein [Verrucomicrobia bacterium]|nr:exported hypothetical protein [Verrucomicrobiota bacterium]